MVTLVRRDNLEKIKVNIDECINMIEKLLIDIQDNLYQRALNRREDLTYNLYTYDELKSLSEKEGGFAYVNWCGRVECENKIKHDLGLKSRCIPIDNNKVDGKCICCERDAITKIYFGKQY